MMLWLIIGIEGVLILFIFAQMLRKRASLRTEEEGPDLTVPAAQSRVDLQLPEEEKWE